MLEARKGTAVVTGAGGGIGRAICLRLAGAGWQVVASDIHGEAAGETAAMCREAGGQGVAHAADVGDEASVIALIRFAQAQGAGLRAFVNNAGIEGVVAPLAEYPVDMFDAVMRVNTRGVFLCMRHALRAMADGGAIVNVASTSAVRGRARLAAYVASKHAVLGLTRVAALEAAQAGVRVNAVLPGPIRTRMIAALDRMATQGAVGTDAGIVRATPAAYGTPEDVAGVVAYLLGDDACHVNGAAWVVDAGSTVA